MRTLLIAALAFTASFAAHGQLIFKTSDRLSKKAKNVIETAYKDYNKRYDGCLGEIIVTDSVIRDSITMKKEYFSVYPGPNKMCINRAELEEDTAFTWKQFRGDLTEEFFLTMAPTDSLPVARPFALNVSRSKRDPTLIDSVIAIHGLKLIVRHGKAHYACDVIETSISHALGRSFASKNYMDRYPSYLRMTNFISGMLNMKEITPNELIRCQKTNDVQGVVGIILGKPKNQVGGKDVNLIVDALFALSDNRIRDFNGLYEEIQEIRYKYKHH